MTRVLWLMSGAAVVAIGLACGGDLGPSDDLVVDVPSTMPAGEGACPAAAVTASSWASGTRVTLIGLHPDDAYYDAEYLGRLPISGVTTGEMTLTEGCWMGGPMEADDGSSYYFYKGAFTQP